jgi:hypothetical protein
MTLLVRELGLRQELRHPDDSVHGRADFVAHIREELGLQTRRGEGLVAGRREGLEEPDALDGCARNRAEHDHLVRDLLTERMATLGVPE